MDATHPDVFVVKHPQRPLMGKLLSVETPLIDLVFKGQTAIESNQGTMLGEIQQPFDFGVVQKFLLANVHHSRCIHAKVSAMVGLGFQSPADLKRKQAKKKGLPAPDTSPEEELAKIDTILDPLCDHSWRDTFSDIGEDYNQVGGGYLEVVRKTPRTTSPITGLHHIRAREIVPFIEDLRYRRHWVLKGQSIGGDRRFARFGDLEGFFKRTTLSTEQKKGVSEVIHFRQPTSLSRWYGFPDWIAATANIELVQALTQFEFDFFFNRGVPEFMFFIIGGQPLASADKDQIEESLKATIGLHNQHKTMFLHIKGDARETKVQIEKLAMESKGDGSTFSATSETLANNIVSAHGVPPLLAGILIPGKLGATNELVQAMQSFQSLVVAPAQEIFQQTLRRTLGNPSLSGLPLGPGDMILNTILDEIDLESMDTVARMRQSPQEAAAEGRDLGAGVQD